MQQVQTITRNLREHTTPRRCIAMLLGNAVMAVGVAALKLSTMGNDPYTASCMAISEGLGMGLGNYQLILNLAMFLIQFRFGAGHIGLGTLFNMTCVGYIVEYSQIPLVRLFGSGAGHGLPYCLVYMAAALVVLSFGLSMYQNAGLGVAPYDFLSLGLTERFRKPYFLFRVLTDGTCVVLILVSLGVGFIGWENSHLGIATVVSAFCLGPLVGVFDKLNTKWIY